MSVNWDDIVFTVENITIGMAPDDMMLFSVKDITLSESKGVMLPDSEDVTLSSSESITLVDSRDMVLVASEDVMLFAAGLPGEAATIEGVSAETLPAGSLATVENLGTKTKARFRFGIPKGNKGDKGDSGGRWGSIDGDIDDQIDLQNVLSGKANISDLGDMAGVNDAPYDNKVYGRQNGAWIESTGGIPDAPHDNKFYVRKNGEWVEIEVS